jgi:hypothetical protein
LNIDKCRFGFGKADFQPFSRDLAKSALKALALETIAE